MILIKGLEMPQGENGLLCLDIYPDGRVFINLNADKGQVATAEQFEPRKHGRWVFSPDHAEGICTRCNYKIYGRPYQNTYMIVPYNYCPNCGAKMDEVEEWADL